MLMSTISAITKRFEVTGEAGKRTYASTNPSHSEEDGSSGKRLSKDHRLDMADNS